MKKVKVLVVATSRKTRGGITSVVKAHEQGSQWNEFHCYWIQTHRDGSIFTKLWYFIRSLIDFTVRLPFYDIIHIHFSNGNSLRRKLIFAKLAHTFQKKIIIHFHAFDPETTIHGKQKSQYLKLFNIAKKIIVLSNWWKNETIRAFPHLAKNIVVIYNPCPAIKTDSNILKEKAILYAGTVNERKGYVDLIKAFAELTTSYPDWKLWIAGNGEIENGKRLAKKLGIKDNVNFLGWIDGNKKNITFQKASIFCLPSYAEGFPMAVLDAWAYGLPVITTPVGGIPDVAKDGDNMLIFQPGDIKKLSICLKMLISNTNLREHIALASRKFSSEEFNVDTINNQLKELYKSL